MKPWIPAAAVLSLLVPLGLAVAPSMFGPPLLCHEFAIDTARSLPWESGMNPKADYDRSHLAADVDALLKSEEDLIVRLETLRRAALYAKSDRALAWELLGHAGLATLDQTSIGAKQANRWFDTGVLVACFDQLGLDLGYRAGVAEGFQGYGYLVKALDAARSEKSASIATIEFVAGIVSHPLMLRGGGKDADYERYQRHMDAAHAGARAGSLLARNMATWEARFTPPARKTGGSNGE